MVQTVPTNRAVQSCPIDFHLKSTGDIKAIMEKLPAARHMNEFEKEVVP